MKRTTISFIGDLDEKDKDSLILIIKSQSKAKKVKFEIVDIDHPLLDYIKTEYEWITNSKIKLPTPEQCEVLTQTYKSTSIKSCLDQLENKQYKDHKTVYFTLKNWLSQDLKNLKEKKQEEKKEPKAEHTEVKKTVEKLNINDWINKL